MIIYTMSKLNLIIKFYLIYKENRYLDQILDGSFFYSKISSLEFMYLNRFRLTNLAVF